ncbi:hypothetical protein CEXT_55661 [Caerostris extrusa]|uniref:Uncharacterized protein n=1 Tax=Caerostris extrusa TaxID=172846 RepID=A0AAV4NCP1_CAEEX|nr:hypothetical protein CEXT_55661 [Caerostris extrusa]
MDKNLDFEAVSPTEQLQSFTNMTAKRLSYKEPVQPEAKSQITRAVPGFLIVPEEHLHEQFKPWTDGGRGPLLCARWSTVARVRFDL